MLAPTDTLPAALPRVRKARHLSQLELSLRLGVSQRHVSFVECGRAKPSRELLLAWLHELDAPLAVRNELLLLAGYAPVYSAAPLSHPALTHANEALDHLLRTHDPMPAMVLDADWNLLRANRGGRWLAATLLPWAVDLQATAPVNMLDLLAHPEGFTKAMVNLAEVGPAVLAHLRQEAVAHPGLGPRVEAFSALLRTKLGDHALHAGAARLTAPMLTSRYATPHGELSFFSTFTTFGTPHDITLASVRVEHMFAADDATRAVLAEHVHP